MPPLGVPTRPTIVPPLLRRSVVRVVQPTPIPRSSSAAISLNYRDVTLVVTLIENLAKLDFIKVGDHGLFIVGGKAP